MPEGLTRREQWALIGVVALIATGLAVQAWRQVRPADDVAYVPAQGRWEKIADYAAGQHPQVTSMTLAAGALPSAAKTKSGTEKLPPNGIDLNRATAADLDRLPGVGAATAQAILQTRARLGGFRTVDQLDDVPRIGPKTLEKIRPYVYVDAAAAPVSTSTVAMNSGASAPSAQAPPSNSNGMTIKKTKYAATQHGPVNINNASAAELDDAITGIGPVLARNIVKDRAIHGPFRTPADLMNRIKGIGPKRIQQMLPQIVFK